MVSGSLLGKSYTANEKMCYPLAAYMFCKENNELIQNSTEGLVCTLIGCSDSKQKCRWGDNVGLVCG